MDKNKENAVMKQLKIHEIRLPLLKTPLGDLEIKRGKEEEVYTFTLDSVPLDKEGQKELSKIYNLN